MSQALNSRALNTAPLGGPAVSEGRQSYALNSWTLNGAPLNGPAAQPAYTADITIKFDDDAVAGAAVFIAPVVADGAVQLDDDLVSGTASSYPAGGFQADGAIQFDDDQVSGAGTFIVPVQADGAIIFDDDAVSGTASVTTVVQGAIQFDGDVISGTATHLPAVRVDGAITLDDDVVNGAGAFDWAALLDPIVTQPYYACDVTVDGITQRLKISSWQASMKVGTSYVQAVIPAIKDDVSDWILSGADVHFAVYKGARFADGGALEELIAEAPLQTPSISGGWLNKTLTLKGYTQFDGQPGAVRELTGIQMLMDDRIRCDIDFFLRPGQQATALGRTVTVGYINYYANDSQQYMDVGEAQ